MKSSVILVIEWICFESYILFVFLKNQSGYELDWFIQLFIMLFVIVIIVTHRDLHWLIWQIPHAFYFQVNCVNFILIEACMLNQCCSLIPLLEKEVQIWNCISFKWSLFIVLFETSIFLLPFCCLTYQVSQIIYGLNKQNI